jgi:hypothetical protein
VNYLLAVIGQILPFSFFSSGASGSYTDIHLAENYPLKLLKK